MKSIFILLFALVTVSAQAQTLHFNCIADKSDSSDGTDQIHLVFSEAGQIQSAQWVMKKTISTLGIHIIDFNLQNSQVKIVKDNNPYNPTQKSWLFLTRVLGSGISVSIAYPVTDFRGRKLSLTESLIGQEIQDSDSETRMVGKLKSIFYNENFPAKWTNSLECHPAP